MSQTPDRFDAQTNTLLPANPPGEARLSALKQVIRGERLPCDLVETRAVLGELARRKCGHIPPELLVEQVVAVTPGASPGGT